MNSFYTFRVFYSFWWKVYWKFEMKFICIYYLPNLIKIVSWFNSATTTQQPSQILEDQLQPIRIMPNNSLGTPDGFGTLYLYISQDARLNFARLFSQDFSCKTCKTKIYFSTLFFWLKLEVFSQKIKLGLTKKFFILSFVTFIQKNTLF